MKTLGKQVITTTRSGNYQYATVESIANGLATVRLSTGGVRLTNLNIYGTLPVAGDTVIVDYTTGTPYVRAAQSTTVAEAELGLALTPLELPSSLDYTYVLLSQGLPSGSISGMITEHSVASSFTFGMVAYINGSGNAAPASASVITTAYPFGICGDLSIGGGSRGTFLLDGFICGSFGFSPGPVFLSLSAGSMTQTPPTGTQECVVVLGTAHSSTLLHFKPSLSIVELL